MISFQCSDFIVELKFSNEKDFSDSFVDSCWDQISLHHFFITLSRFDLAKHCYMYLYSFCFGVTSS